MSAIQRIVVLVVVIRTSTIYAVNTKGDNNKQQLQNDAMEYDELLDDEEVMEREKSLRSDMSNEPSELVESFVLPEDSQLNSSPSASINRPNTNRKRRRRRRRKQQQSTQTQWTAGQVKIGSSGPPFSSKETETAAESYYLILEEDESGTPVKYSLAEEIPTAVSSDESGYSPVRKIKNRRRPTFEGEKLHRKNENQFDKVKNSDILNTPAFDDEQQGDDDNHHGSAVVTRSKSMKNSATTVEHIETSSFKSRHRWAKDQVTTTTLSSTMSDHDEKYDKNNIMKYRKTTTFSTTLQDQNRSVHVNSHPKNDTQFSENSTSNVVDESSSINPSTKINSKLRTEFDPTSINNTFVYISCNETFHQIKQKLNFTSGSNITIVSDKLVKVLQHLHANHGDNDVENKENIFNDTTVMKNFSSRRNERQLFYVPGVGMVTLSPRDRDEPSNNKSGSKVQSKNNNGLINHKLPNDQSIESSTTESLASSNNNNSFYNKKIFQDRFGLLTQHNNVRGNGGGSVGVVVERKKLSWEVKSSIILSGGILAIAVFSFFALLVTCKIRQQKLRIKSHQSDLFGEQLKSFKDKEERDWRKSVRRQRDASPITVRQSSTPPSPPPPAPSAPYNGKSLRESVRSNRNYWQY